MSGQKLIAILLLFAALAALPTTINAGSDAKMEAWVRAATPGEPHAGLAEQVGEWRYVVTFWEKPEGPPTTYKGVSTKKMIMDGRFLQEEISGEPTDRPFRGFGITGYDNVTKEYVAVWLDNMSTGIPYSTGQLDAKGGRTFQSTFHDPATGKAVRTRSVSRVIDRDHHTYESFVTLPDGAEQLQMRVEYTRASS